MKLTIKNARLAFPVLFEPRAVNGEGKPAYSANLLLNADDPQIQALDAAIEKVAHEKWGEKALAVLKQLRANNKIALHSGDLKANYEGFAGNMYVSARSQTRPTVVDRNRSQLTERDGKPYSGCMVNAIIELWPQDSNFGKRINASLKGVQFVEDGEAFAGGVAACMDDFPALPDVASAAHTF